MNFVLGLSFLQNLVVVLFVLICAAIIFIVLLQKGRGGGLSGAFGGGGAGSLLGTKTGDFLTWVTICLVAAFLVMAVLMGKFMRPKLPSGGPMISPPASSAEMPAAQTPSQEQMPTASDAAEPIDMADEAAEDIEVPAGTETQDAADPTN